MRITLEELERRKMVAEAKLIMTKAMGQVLDEVGELYYSEWFSILNEMSGRLIGDMLKEDWRGEETQP